MKYPDDFINKIICGDCLEFMKQIPDKSVDLVLTDPPYGITACDWDKLPDFTALWAELKRIGKDNCAYVFTASQPFTTDLINSNRDWFVEELIWLKNKSGSGFNTNKKHIKIHENIIIFRKK